YIKLWGIRKTVWKSKFYKNYRSCNILAFRGRVVSLLALRAVGSYDVQDVLVQTLPQDVAFLVCFPRCISRRTRKASPAKHRTKKRCSFLFEESRIFHSLEIS